MLGEKVETIKLAGTAKRDLYESIFDMIFKPMREGRLTVELPDGRKFLYGDGQGGVQADITMRNRNMFRKCFWTGDVGFGEAAARRPKGHVTLVEPRVREGSESFERGFGHRANPTNPSTRFKMRVQLSWINLA